MELSKLDISQSLKASFREYKKVASNIFLQQNIDLKENDIDLRSYARYIFSEGSSRQKAEFVRGLGIPLYLYNKNIYTELIKLK